MPNISIWEILLLLLVLLLVFGPKRLPQMGRSLGHGMREFKDSITGKSKHEDEDDEEEQPAKPEQPAVVAATATPETPVAAAPVAAPPVETAPAPEPTKNASIGRGEKPGGQGRNYSDRRTRRARNRFRTRERKR